MNPSANQSHIRNENQQWNIPTGLELQLGLVIQGSNSTFSHSTPNEYDSTVAPKRIEIFLDGDSSQLNRVGTQLADKLAALKCIEQIDVRSAGSELSGKRAPDLRIRLLVREQYPIPGWLRLSPWSLIPSTLRVGFEISPFSTNVHANYLRPSTQMRSYVNLRGGANSVVYGFASPHSRAVDTDPFAEPTDLVIEKMKAMLSNSPLVPSHPEVCFGTYQPPPEFAFLERLNARMVVAESDLLLHTKVAWSLVVPDWAELNRIRAELVALNFPDPHGPPEGFATTIGIQGDQWIGLEPTHEFLSRSSWSRGDGTSGVTPPEVNNVEFTFQYHLNFSKEEVQSATDAILALNDPGFLKTWSMHPTVRKWE